METFRVWQYRLWSFQTGDTKLERLLPKNQHTQRKLWNYEFWINGELPKFDFQSQFLNHFITRMTPYFRQLPINPKLKI